MIVTCPTCATRYLVDPRALGFTGRAVRCTQCSHVWMQIPPDDAPRRVDLPAPGQAPARPQRALPAPTPAAAQQRPALPALPAIVAAPPPRPAAASRDEFPYPDARTERAGRGGRSSVVILFLVLLVLGGLWLGRDAIVEYIPAFNGVYSALGLADAGDPRADLEFRAVTSDRQQENGHATLVIHGEVANISATTRHVPPLRITLEDAARHPIKSWTVVATSAGLRPGATVAFRTTVADPGDKSVGASVAFVAGAD